MSRQGGVISSLLEGHPLPTHLRRIYQSEPLLQYVTCISRYLITVPCDTYLQCTDTDQFVLTDQKGLEECSKHSVALHSIRLFKSKGETITIFLEASSGIQRKKVLFFANILSLYSYPVYLGCSSLSWNYMTLDLELYNYFI